MEIRVSRAIRRGLGGCLEVIEVAEAIITALAISITEWIEIRLWRLGKFNVVEYRQRKHRLLEVLSQSSRR